LDEADYERLSKHRWHMGGRGYAYRSAGRAGVPTIAMHREVLGLQPGGGVEVDHINRNKLDNRRSNLRLVDKRGQAENRPSIGKSRYRGVSRHPNTKWYAGVTLDGKMHRLGSFLDERIAALVAERFRLDHMPCATPQPSLVDLRGVTDLTCAGCGVTCPPEQARFWLLSPSDEPRCFDCHDVELPKRGKPFQPPKPCSHCGEMTNHRSRGRCDSCYAYFRRNGEDRPKIQHYRAKNSGPWPCPVCHRMAPKLTLDRCAACYAYWRRSGRERVA
jgi:hypothetical protein